MLGRIRGFPLDDSDLHLAGGQRFAHLQTAETIPNDHCLADAIGHPRIAEEGRGSRSPNTRTSLRPGIGDSTAQPPVAVANLS